MAFYGTIANKRLLFAQASDKLKLLSETSLYKVGHHGSRNATPKTLWNHFANKSEANKKGRLQTVVSTMPGKHGSKDKHTEVPRLSLVKAMKQQSDYYTTESLTKKDDLFHDIEIDL